MIFRGTFEHSLDAKHRLTIPAKYRAAFAGGVVLAASPGIGTGSLRAVAIWTPEANERFATAALAGKNPLSPQARTLSNLLYGLSHETELDAANRVMIPPKLLSYAGLEKDVVITGSGPCLEVWNRAAHAAYEEEAIADFPEIAASFDHSD